EPRMGVARRVSQRRAPPAEVIRGQAQLDSINADQPLAERRAGVVNEDIDVLEASGEVRAQASYRHLRREVTHVQDRWIAGRHPRHRLLRQEALERVSAREDNRGA